MPQVISVGENADRRTPTSGACASDEHRIGDETRRGSGDTGFRAERLGDYHTGTSDVCDVA